MKIFIQPNDVLFFRDGKPFNAGSDNSARLDFPPTPVTFYGALRTAFLSLELKNFGNFKEPKYLSEAMKEVVGFAENVGEKTNPVYKIKSGSLKIKDFGLGIIKEGKVKRLYPLPSDIVKIKDKDKFHILSPGELGDDEITNMPIAGLKPLSNDEIGGEFVEDAEGYLTEDGFNKYLTNKELQKDDFVIPSEIFTTENRVGIARNSESHASEEGKLYSIEFARLNKNTGFLVEVEGIGVFNEKIKQQKLIRLGGECRSAACNYEIDWETPSNVNNNSHIKIITLTPVVFDNGWLPDDFDSNGEGSINGVKAKLTSAAVKKNIGIGGWDIVNNIAKPVRRAVPAGSVYYFNLASDNKMSIPTNQFIHIGQETEKGLGQAIIGGY